ncbi:hypothetical protein D3C86_1298450 [compost metagenome]
MGPFDIEGETARTWLKLPVNPNGEPNAYVIRQFFNGIDLTQRYSDKWIVDFGVTRSEEDASLFEAPFEFIAKSVYPERQLNRREAYRKFWWRFAEPRPAMRDRIEPLSRYLATPEVSKHRVFVWLQPSAIPSNKVYAITRDDDVSFGVLQSRFHEVWALRVCSWHGKGNDPRYTPSTTFETFPFPEGLSPNIPAADYAEDPRAKAIADAARRLNLLRENWLNPPDLVKRVPEVVPGFPDRVLPVDGTAAKELKKRTLTNLYNQKPSWLIKAHEALDAAVAAAYGWEPAISNEEALRRLLQLNLERARKASK